MVRRDSHLWNSRPDVALLYCLVQILRSNRHHGCLSLGVSCHAWTRGGNSLVKHVEIVHPFTFFFTGLSNEEWLRLAQCATHSWLHNLDLQTKNMKSSRNSERTLLTFFATHVAKFRCAIAHSLVVVEIFVNGAQDHPKGGRRRQDHQGGMAAPHPKHLPQGEEEECSTTHTDKGGAPLYFTFLSIVTF